jgi:serine/threonine protein kinase
VLHQIGVGALGPVFRTYEPTRDRLVAVKVFRLDVTPEQARALADELARAADAGLFHPSIVEPLGAGIEGTVAYRAEEYVAAESLDVALRHYAPATMDKVLPFITQLASALDFARAAGVGHGALHPRDIFVTPDEARATGFGVVDALDRMGLRAPVRRPYSPPERIAGHAWGSPADVFSLAVIAFELLTGRRPSGLGDDMGSLSGATLGEPADRVRAVLARAMHENPSERYATAQAFSAALAQAAGVPETTVSLVTRSTSVPSTPTADRDLRIAPPAPVGNVDELPLAAEASVDQPARDLVIQYDAALERGTLDSDQVLDDFPVESEAPSPGDSPREVARKMIAAREVRKRQVRTKTEKAAADGSTDAVQPLSAPDSSVDSSVVSNVAPEVAPVAGVLFAAVSDEVPAEADVVEVPALEAVAFAPAARDLADRVVGVDEFRAREAAGPKPDRIWPRVPERIEPGRIESGRIEFENARPERVVVPKVSAIKSIDSDVPPPPFEAPASERQRLVMLPLALVLSLGLVLGYAAGYVVGNRETLASGEKPDTPPTSAESQTPTTGRTAPKETTEQVVPALAPVTRAAPPREARPAATTGRIVVTSSPAKAAVTINGKWRGRTPLTVNDLRFGKYVVRVVQEGYEVAREQFTLSRGAATRTMDVTLRGAPPPQRAPAPAARAPQVQPAVPSKPPAPATGELFVDSRPQGARVFIDGKERGVTPLRLPGHPVGAHVVRLELADHQFWARTTQVVARKTVRVTGSLERIR